MSANYERKIIIVGKTGNGKSSLGNVLLGKAAFDAEPGFNAVTKECKVGTDEGNVSVVDTPGLFDSDGERSLKMQALEIQKAITLFPNPHAFLIVLNGFGRLTEEELSTIDVLRVIFGEQCLETAVIVLTHIENNIDDTQLKKRIKENSKMSNLIKQCGDRFARIDTKNPKSEHIHRIIRYVDQVSQAGRNSFKNKYLNLNKQVLNEKALDSEPVHVQIEWWSKEIMKAVEKQIEFERKCWGHVKKACVAVVTILPLVRVATPYLGGSSTAVAIAVTNPEAQVAIEKSVSEVIGSVRACL